MKRVLIIISFVFFVLNVFSQNKIPKLFKLDWGSSFSLVSDKTSIKDVGLTPLKHYQIYKNTNENDDLKYSGFVKYKCEGIPFFNIPASVIFTFYNPEGLKNKLLLSKIEVYLQKKDNHKIDIDIKSIFKNLISVFCENYSVKLKVDEEREVFTNYIYQLTVNDVFVNFVANIDTNIFENNEAIFFSYESNKFQKLILKRESEISKEKEENIIDEKNNNDIKNNL